MVDGKPRAWVCWVIALACVITMLLVIIGPRMLYEQGGRSSGISEFWFCHGLAIQAGFWIAVIAVLRGRLSRFLNAAVLLPVIHLATILTAWGAWTVIAPRMFFTSERQPLVEVAPMGTIVVAMAVTCCGAGWLVARRRRREWVHATVTIALAFVLLLGLWLPVVCRRWCGPSDTLSWDRDLLIQMMSARLVAAVLVPPVVGAVVFAALALRRAQTLHRHRVPLGVGIGFGLAAAVTDRIGVSMDASFVYANFLPFVLSAGLVALGALVALGVASWTRPLLVQASYCGGIAPDDADTDVVARFEITSWLRGPRAVVRAFTVTTAAGAVPVPSGAKLAVPLPAATTHLRVGESIDVLRHGDRVLLEGFVELDPEQPFRDSLAPLAGDRGVSVGAPNTETSGFESIALAIWRPCVAYLLILTAIGLPALAALLTTP